MNTKKYFFIIVGILLMSSSLANKPLKNAVAEFDSTNQVKGYFQSLNKFERIISFDKDNWIPYYYSALCLLNIAMESEQGEIDEYCDKADDYIEKADSLKPNNSEIYCLKALTASVRISVSPEERGFRFVTLSNSYLSKAQNLNNSNPRVYYLKGMNTINMPPMMGGGIDAAMKHFENALKLFNKEQKVQDNSILPHWGYKSCESVVEKLKEKKANG